MAKRKQDIIKMAIVTDLFLLGYSTCLFHSTQYVLSTSDTISAVLTHFRIL